MPGLSFSIREINVCQRIHNIKYASQFSGLTFSKTNTKEKDDGPVRWPVSLFVVTLTYSSKKASFSLLHCKRERERERLLKTFSLAIL
jgi:hypothetical protein